MRAKIFYFLTFLLPINLFFGSLSATSNTTLLFVGNTATLTAIANGGVSIYTYTWNPVPVSNTAIASICTGIFGSDPKNESLFSVFPNPNNSDFYIATNSNITLNIYNTLGQLVMPVFLDENTNKQAVILNLTNGIYYLVAQNNRQTITQKIIVAR